jgi:GNAT superfamily N-acetyltransferase
VTADREPDATGAGFTLRTASPADSGALVELIGASARGLARGDYTDAQIEAALGSAWGVDSQLIRDGTYFVVEAGGAIVACGGWSFRRTLFGGDAQPGRVPESLDPSRDAARIRAFFVHPRWARRGLGALLLRHCEAAAMDRGFRRAELLATLPGHRLYRAFGYEGDARRRYPLPGGLDIEFVPMSRHLL